MQNCPDITILNSLFVFLSFCFFVSLSYCLFVYLSVRVQTSLWSNVWKVSKVTLCVQILKWPGQLKIKTMKTVKSLKWKYLQMVDQYVIDNLGVTAYIFTWYWAWSRLLFYWEPLLNCSGAQLALIYWTNLARIGNFPSDKMDTWCWCIRHFSRWDDQKKERLKVKVVKVSEKSIVKGEGKLDQWQGVMSFIPRGLRTNASLAAIRMFFQNQNLCLQEKQFCQDG